MPESEYQSSSSEGEEEISSFEGEDSEDFIDEEGEGSAFDFIVQETDELTHNESVSHGIGKVESEKNEKDSDIRNLEPTVNLKSAGAGFEDGETQNRSPSPNLPHQGPISETNLFPLINSEPKLHQVAQHKEDANQDSLKGCSETLITLLSRKTPLKDKLKLIEDEKELKPTDHDISTRSQSKKEISQFSPRITRSQAKRRSSLANFTSSRDSNGDKNSEYRSLGSSISNRIDEIGDLCGFAKEKAQGKGRLQGGKAKKGGSNQS
ncbi:hypothetical protein L2E82_49970 [Cichorium intybus]|nr:hypothetical protein L2E82_49970 [Cichorium intybus]